LISTATERTPVRQPDEQSVQFLQSPFYFVMLCNIKK